MQNNKIMWVTIVLLVVIFIGLIFWQNKQNSSDGMAEENAFASTTETFDQSISDETVKISYSSGLFGLAVNPTQILVNSNIPPCDESFEYCIYYNADMFKDTNFESAGLRIKKRVDLKNETTCLNTPPAGYDNSVLPNTKIPKDAYSTAIFEGMGNSSAGNLVRGSNYRLYFKKNASCYELESRVAYSQFDNYPKGSIKQFGDSAIALMEGRLKNIIKSVTLPDGQVNIFP